MEEESGFDSVQWDRADRTPTSPARHSFEDNALPHRTASDNRGSTGADGPQAGDNADALDLAGIGIEGTLDCTVDSPLKENDGSKDAYVSYRVTTHVCSLNRNWSSPY